MPPNQQTGLQLLSHAVGKRYEHAVGAAPPVQHNLVVQVCAGAEWWGQCRSGAAGPGPGTQPRWATASGSTHCRLTCDAQQGALGHHEGGGRVVESVIERIEVLDLSVGIRERPVYLLRAAAGKNFFEGKKVVRPWASVEDGES